MNLGFKYRVYPTKEQKVFFAKSFGCCRKVWNLMLAGELPLPCGTEVPMEVASDSRNNYSSLTRGFWLFVPIMAYSLMPLSL